MRSHTFTSDPFDTEGVFYTLYICYIALAFLLQATLLWLFAASHLQPFSPPNRARITTAFYCLSGVGLCGFVVVLSVIATQWLRDQSRDVRESYGTTYMMLALLVHCILLAPLLLWHGLCACIVSCVVWSMRGSF